jgi:hypothetical protein
VVEQGNPTAAVADPRRREYRPKAVFERVPQDFRNTVDLLVLQPATVPQTSPACVNMSWLTGEMSSKTLRMRNIVVPPEWCVVWRRYYNSKMPVAMKDIHAKGITCWLRESAL